MANLFRYPKQLQLPGADVTYMNSAEDFLAHYDEILSEDFIKTLESLLTQPLSYRYDGTFLGDDTLWMSSAGGALLVDSLFPSDTVQMKPTGDGAVTVAPGTEP